ncbi:hypothetical protein KYB31_07775 [Clostridium felsineum]|uniref:hypothetical protein n=1 Tax=Clostridium felsineum TaxID=36839 RepID=UPI00214D3238|nr:hypothetical protein [Clostridium felsineum]MCR3758887.1 hypothetical protein [Clostridium felsineum]
MLKKYRYFVYIVYICTCIIAHIYVCEKIHISVYKLIFNVMYISIFFTIFVFSLCIHKTNNLKLTKSIFNSFLIWCIVSSQFFLMEYINYVFSLQLAVNIPYVISVVMDLKKKKLKK